MRRASVRAWLSPAGWAALTLFLLALLPRAGYWWLKGTRLSPDSHSYIAACETLAASPLSYLGTQRGLLFSGFTVPFCGVWTATGGFPTAWVAIQILLSSLAVVLVFDATRRLVDFRSGVVAGLAMAGLFETFSWSIYVLSDTLFVFGVSVSIWALVRHRQEPRPRTRSAALACLGFTAIARPFGAPLVAAWLLLDVLPDRYADYRLHLLPRRVAAGLAVAGLVGVVAFVSIYQSRLLADYVLPYYTQGIVVHDDPTFTYAYDAAPAGSLVGFVLANWPHLVAISALRVAALFLPVVGRFSLLHNVVNLLTLAPLLVGSAIAIFEQFRRRETAIYVLLVPLLVLTGIVALTWVDFDWRYRAPLGPAFAVLTGYAVGRNAHLRRLRDRLAGTVTGLRRLAERKTL